MRLNSAVDGHEPASRTVRRIIADALPELMTAVKELEGPARFIELARLRRLIRRGDYAPGRPIVFHHIHKTAGTSLNRALASLTPLYCHSGGNLSPAYAQRLIGLGLRERQIIAGHAATGAMRPFEGQARVITVIRRPAAQVISNYLWIRQHSRIADHGLARSLNLRDFLVQRPYFIAFQTASLHVGIERTPLTRTEDLFDRLPLIRAYLESMYRVGVTDRLQALVDAIAADFGRPAPTLARQLQTRIDPAERERLEAQFAEAERHPSIAHLFELDRALFARATELAGRVS